MNNHRSLELIHSTMPKDYLEHHGIKGQKWGVKHGPPYPLSDEVSRSIRINRINKSRFVKYTSKNSDLIANQPAAETMSELQHKDRDYTIFEDAALVNNRAQRGKVGRVFNCQNCACAFEMRRRGYDVCARLRDDGSNVFSIENNFSDGHVTTFDASEMVKDIDPHDNESNADYYRRRTELALDVFKKFEDELSEQPVGARGIVTVGWVSNFYKSTVRTSDYHAFNYEIGKDGRPLYFDTEGQVTPDKLSFRSEYFTDKFTQDAYDLGLEDEKGLYKVTSTYATFVDPREWSYMRTDNLDVNSSITSSVISRKLVDKDDN